MHLTSDFQTRRRRWTRPEPPAKPDCSAVYTSGFAVETAGEWSAVSTARAADAAGD